MRLFNRKERKVRKEKKIHHEGHEEREGKRELTIKGTKVT
jgi:hypothetical protein